MSLERCIPDLVKEGKLTREQADDAMQIYGGIKKRLSSTMSDAAAEALASDRAVAALEAKAQLARRQKVLQVKAQKNAIASIVSFDNGSGKDPGAAAIALLVRDERANYKNVEYHHLSIRAQALAGLDQFLLKNGRNVAGVLKDKAGLADLVREAFGEHSGNDAARQWNEAWQKTAEWLRQRRNAAGGDTGKLADWGMPQTHDSLSVAQAGWEKWRDTIVSMLDRDRMVDGATGTRLSDADFDAALHGVFETISKDGWNNKQPGGQIGVGKLANQRADHRFLIFKDADGWMQYQHQFGGAGTPFDIMMRHIDAVSRETAMMEILGPNPTATIKWLKDGLDKRASMSADAKVRDGVLGPKAVIDRVFGELTGANMAPENRAIALVASTARSFQMATKLGSATISALGDFANQTMTRAYNGLPVAHMFNGYIRQLVSSGDRASAIRMMLGAEDIARAIGDDTRFSMAQHGSETVKRIAEGVLKASGLDAITRAGRYAFGMDAISTLTSESVKSFATLDGRFSGMLQRYGIGPAEWDAIRSTPLEQERGGHWLKPGSIADQDLRDRVIGMILAETDMAVPAAGLRTRAAVNGLLPRGNVMAEVARSAFQFKGFGISMLAANWRRMMASSTVPGKLGYALGYTALLSVVGTGVIQLRELLNGNDPRPLDDPNLWLQGFFQGGAAGIYGDFVNNAQNRFGGGIADTLAGPMWSDANQIGKVAIGDQFAQARGEPTNRGREFSKLIQQETPGGSLWYGRVAYQRLLQHWLQEQVDPHYHQSFQQMRTYARQQGQDMWWKPGELQPDRAPNFDNAIHGKVPPHHHRL